MSDKILRTIYIILIPVIFFVVENRFEELEMQSMHTKCVAEELKDYDLCVTKIEAQYQRKLL